MAIFITPGGGAPGGSDTQIQFNDNGVFGGDVDLTYNKTTNLLTNKGDIRLDDSGTYTTTLQTITPTAARTISFPDATGTVALVGGSSGQLLYNNAGANAGASTLTYDGSILTTSGRFINSYNATASAPAKAFTGTWFTGGTATTTKPQVLVEPTGTTSTAWSTSGTGLGVNAASGFVGRLLDLQLNGTSNFNVDSTGRVSFPLATAALPALYPGADTNTGMWSPAADTLAWSTNGVERTRIDSAGRVGIGTSTPGSLLTLRQSGGPTVILEGDTASADQLLGQIKSETATTLNSDNPASLRFYSSGSTGGHHGGYVSIWTCPQNSGGEVERIRITQLGVVQIADAGNIAVGTTTGTKIGTATTQKLGFYNATPVVQPAAVANIITTATAGSLPTPDGSVTIADATTPTVTELLEYCVELESKLEAALGHLRTLGLIAT